jgi:hypothetical protein
VTPVAPVRVGSRLPPHHVPRIPPQHPLQLLGRQPAPETSPRVLLGSLDERLTKALVQAGVAFDSSFRKVPLRITHDTRVTVRAVSPRSRRVLALLRLQVSVESDIVALVPQLDDPAIDEPDDVNPGVLDRLPGRSMRPADRPAQDDLVLDREVVVDGDVEVRDVIPEVADQALDVFAADHVTIGEMVHMLRDQKLVDDVESALIPALVEEAAGGE